MAKAFWRLVRWCNLIGNTDQLSGRKAEKLELIGGKLAQSGFMKGLEIVLSAVPMLLKTFSRKSQIYATSSELPLEL
jgi:hypothetical protein